MARLSMRTCDERGDASAGSHMMANETTAAFEGGPTRCFTLGASSKWKGDADQDHNSNNLPAECEPPATVS
jgi:hypothetical protein